MSPSFEENDVMIMNNVANFERGDIISFIPEGKEITLIKRII
jgi:hypothetical protein